jgi:predicted site-specific integrase-resolvase
MITIYEAAKKYGCNPQSIRRYIRAGILPAERGNRHNSRAWMVDPNVLAEILPAPISGGNGRPVAVRFVAHGSTVSPATPRPEGASTPRELARDIGVSYATVDRWLREGVIGYERSERGHIRWVMADQCEEARRRVEG